MKALFKIFYFTNLILLLIPTAFAQQQNDPYKLVWNSQSKNSGESMPCGGGDIGLNVWVENNEILFYISKSGTFDENNTLLKLGRVRVKLSPNPFINGSFKQELDLKAGLINITARSGKQRTQVKVWVDVFQPVVHLGINSNQNLNAEAVYENWRFQDRITKGKENNANSWKWAPQGIVMTKKDFVDFKKDQVVFYHRNTDNTVFDAVVKQQGLESVKDQLSNPIKNLTFGGTLLGENMLAAGETSGKYIDTDYKGWKITSNKPSKKHHIKLILHTEQSNSLKDWHAGLANLQKNMMEHNQASVANEKWWKAFWDKSYIHINTSDTSAAWQASRNYQLFRYMLGCNAFGNYPTKFNGGLFTYDPSLTDSTLKFTPDFRNWGGGTHTAQNQRLVYWPMLKSGDFEMMQAQFKFYLNALKNAELRTKTYWNHNGASFTEQLENFGLPNPAEYGWKRPETYDKGMEYNAWLEYEWDTVLEFCLMMLEQERYTGKAIPEYIPFIESCLTFFNEHYQYLAKQRGSKAFNGDGKLILYPGSAAETYKMAYNANSTIAALQTVLERLLALPEAYLTPEKRLLWENMAKRIPPITFREFNGKTTISPAKLWERINNTESPQLYPVYPWGIFGIGKPGLDTAINTYKYDPDVLKFRSHVGWKQDNIFAARLGLEQDAFKLTVQKLKDSGRRFPAFWGPGFDWTPDHNWGGSGMIGLQEMLMQTDGKKIYIFPTWTKNTNVSFKLHAPYQTTIEASLKNGKIEHLKVIPESRRKDIINLLNH